METPSKTQNVKSSNDLTVTNSLFKGLKRFFSLSDGTLFVRDASNSSLIPVDFQSDPFNVHFKNEDPFGADLNVLIHLQNISGHE